MFALWTHFDFSCKFFFFFLMCWTEGILTSTLCICTHVCEYVFGLSYQQFQVKECLRSGRWWAETWQSLTLPAWALHPYGCQLFHTLTFLPGIVLYTICGDKCLSVLHKSLVTPWFSLYSVYTMLIWLITGWLCMICSPKRKYHCLKTNKLTGQDGLLSLKIGWNLFEVWVIMISVVFSESTRQQCVCTVI